MIESAGRLTNSLKAYKELLEQPALFAKVENVFRKVKYSYLA